MSAISYAKRHDFGIKQRFVRRYHSLANRALLTRGNLLLPEFSQLKTDIERVDYFMEILRSANEGKSLDDIFSKNYVRLLVKSDNGKSDHVSRVYLLHGMEAKEKDDYYMALYGLTKAIFHAATKERLALSLLERSDLLFLLGLYKEAIHDVKEALRVSISDCEVIAESKPVGLILSVNRTKYCYTCLKRCHNLLPCQSCAQVGFCSTKCAKRAKEDKRKGDFYPHRHKYDCNGFLPVIFNCLNAKNPKSIGRLNHTAYTCIANTKPRRLLQFICSKGKYKNINLGNIYMLFRPMAQTEGICHKLTSINFALLLYICLVFLLKKRRGHPAFFGIEHVRKGSPPLWNSSDYASVAWLNPYSNKWNSVEGTYGTMMLDFTVASVLLTYCLHLCGYPMDWTYSKSTRFSDKPPANWIAACLLYHLQSINVNAFSFCDIIRCDQVSKFEDLASPIYPAFSLINHSCDPSAILIASTKGVGLLVALKELKAGSEVNIAYYDIYTHRSTEERKEGLKNMFFFECKCVACENGWDDDNSEEKLKCPRCNLGLCFAEEVCLNCKSNLPHEEAEQMFRDFNVFVEYASRAKWTKEEKRRLSSLISKVHSLVSPPSRMATTLRMVLFDMILETLQLWTYESWIANFYVCNYFEESRELREHRSLILE
ncbi:unnamed protein product [Rodentolepis nana]|uniref:SET domain-containing protein n=1 Tax=Rodentolepis nana TaxID=102285 RepID=A0A0R3TML6_RODNA|nr:unnamed protein product [Rodentolepis nana]